MDLQGLEKWFHDNAKRINTDKQGAYWQLRRDGNRMVFMNNTVGEVAESWELLEYYVRDQLQQGAKMLKVYYKNEPRAKNEVEYMIKTPAYGAPGSQQQGQAAIAGPGSGYLTPQIGQLYEERMADKVQAMQERYEAKLQALEAKYENERRLQELEDHIHAIREEKKTAFDRLMEALEERPAITDKVIGALAPAIQGVLLNLTPARAQVAVQGAPHGAAVPAPQAQNAEAVRMEGQEESVQGTQMDFNASSQAMINLAQAGFPEAGEDLLRLSDCAMVLKQLGYENPVETFEALTKYARENPEMAKNILSNLK